MQVKINVVKLGPGEARKMGTVIWDTFRHKFTIHESLPTAVRRFLRGLNKKGWVPAWTGGRDGRISFTAVVQVGASDLGFLRAVDEAMPHPFALERGGKSI